MTGVDATGLVVAPGAAAPGATDGARLLDSVVDTGEALRSGDWMGVLLSGMSGATEAVASATDPLAELVAAGCGWLLEHVPRLRGALDDLAGDRAAIDALAAAPPTDLPDLELGREVVRARLAERLDLAANE
ncbi:MAG TPA: hypothetical protein VD813_12690, partial [Pseudonocardia sp.]|nr:hypothetical protein [Pseudonocardia sp.]